MTDKTNLSQRLQALQPSPTLVLSAKVAELKAKGENIVGMTAGEPDFNTPQHIIDAATQAMNEGKTKYTASNGVPELRQAIQKTVKQDYKLDVEQNQIVIGCGGKSVLINTMLALLGEGDEALVLAPYWVSYPHMVRLCGAEAKIIECSQENGFLLTAQQLENAITPKTKLLILNSPSNPTGAIIDQQNLKEIAEVLERHPQVFVIEDDVYQHLVYEGKFASLASVASDALMERVIIVNALSKAYSMTGWRLGWGVAHPVVAKAITSLVSQTFAHPTSFVQYAAVVALNGSRDFLNEWRATFKERRDVLVETLNSIDGVECLNPPGAFYVYPKVEGLLGLTDKKRNKKLMNDSDVAEFLLEEAQVAGVPGIAFGLEPHIRLSYAVSTEDVQQACVSIKAACALLSK